MDEPQIRTRCACGWEQTGPVDAVVAATIEHGRRVHNMTATPDQVLATAEAIATDAVAGDDHAAGPPRAR